MGKGLATATIIGNLGKDPEIRSTSSGRKVASFGLAVEDGFGGKISTSWWNCVAWGELADFTEKHLKKGKTVSVVGKLTSRSWDDKTGQKKYITEIVAKDISFFDSGSGGASRGSAAPERRETPAAAHRAAASDPFADDSDPF